MTSIREWLCSYLCQPQYNIPTNIRETGDHIGTLLRRQFPGAHLRVADEVYVTPSKEAFAEWLEYDQTNRRVFKPEYSDCDDFARALRCELFKLGRQHKCSFSVAYCEGETPAGYHAYNMLIDSRDMLHIIEPQTDRMMSLAESEYVTDFIQL